MIKKHNNIHYLNDYDQWLTYVNKGWIKWIFEKKMRGLSFGHTDMTDIDIKGELVIVREDIDTDKPSDSRPEYVKRIVIDDNGRILVTERN